MSKTEELNSLFEKWKGVYYKHARFIKDGIINEELWNNSHPKVLFLLKEANDNDKKYGPLLKSKYEDDLRRLWDETPWYRIGCLNYALQHVTKNSIPNFKLTDQGYKEACKCSAIVNLKKSPGVGRSDPKILIDHFKNNKDNVEKNNARKQIEIIDPDVIVFGGVFDIIQYLEILGKEELILDRVYRFEHLKKSIIGINFAHPSACINIEILYYALAAIYQKYLNFST